MWENYTTDSVQYRLAKFANEFELHFNKAFCIFYYVLTNTLIMFDSRAKNMMLASWGPESKENPNYIWYPIFYDLDTQLGVNNSGVVYWDYDNDADNPSAPIFSGASSVLWNNINKCFQDEAKSMY
jgi:hypothetical protein